MTECKHLFDCKDRDFGETCRECKGSTLMFLFSSPLNCTGNLIEEVNILGKYYHAERGYRIPGYNLCKTRQEAIDGLIKAYKALIKKFQDSLDKLE